MIKIFDITKYPCPILFVKAKILLESLVLGERAILRFKGKDTRKTLPKTLEEDGFKITNYLVKERSFSEDRIHSTLNRLKKALERKSQNLDQWF